MQDSDFQYRMTGYVVVITTSFYVRTGPKLSPVFDKREHAENWRSIQWQKDRDNPFSVPKAYEIQEVEILGMKY